MTTLDDALRDATLVLTQAGLEQPRAEARALLAHLLNLTSAQILIGGDSPIEASALARFQESVSQRCSGMPLAYITGSREFWSLPLQVSSATLIPRPDTETLVELVLEHFRNCAPPRSVVDLGTGSGCLLMALLTEFPDARGLGIDISADALRVAQANAAMLGLDARCDWRAGSWTEVLSDTHDLIVANPPYIPSDDIASLQIDVRDFEPIGALDGGADGLDAYRSLLPAAKKALAEDGVLAVEIGIEQGGDVTAIALACGLVPGPVRCDLSGIERSLSFYRKK